MDLLNPQEAAAEQERVNRLRQTGIKQAQDVASAAQEGATNLEQQGGQALQQASDFGRRDVAAQAAEALAQARSMGAKGGISYGGLLQAGKDTGLGQAKVEAGIAQQKLGLTKDVAQAKQEAAAQALEATKFATQAGSEAQDRQKKMADYDAKMQEILKSTKGFFNDDEDLAAQKIAEMVAGETDPAVKQHYLNQAKMYGTKGGGWFGLGGQGGWDY